jgi:hypothetical protein
VDRRKELIKYKVSIPKSPRLPCKTSDGPVACRVSKVCRQLSFVEGGDKLRPPFHQSRPPSWRAYFFSIPKSQTQLSSALSPSSKQRNSPGQFDVESAIPPPDFVACRGYIVSVKPLKSEAEKAAFAMKIQKWVETKVARHKFLRGGG